jgi:hypothetical protein
MKFLQTAPADTLVGAEDAIAATTLISEQLDMENDTEVEFDLDAEVIGEEITLDSEDAADLDALVKEDAAALNTSRKVVVKTRQQKLALLKQRAAMQLAKNANDPDYKRYMQFRKMEIGLRVKIVRKYGSKAQAVVRQILSGINLPAIGQKHKDRNPK